jgi:hypothetical protein
VAKKPRFSLDHYVAFKLTDVMRNQLIAIADELGTTVSGVIRLMIADSLKRKISGPTIASNYKSKKKKESEPAPASF